MPDLLPVNDPVLVFAIVAVLILLAPIVMARWRLPGMVGLLLAGAILGPNALGVLERDQSFILFGTVGLLYIMFLAALEIDMSILRRYRLHSLVFGLATFAIPMALGLAVSRWVLGFEWPAAILLASTFASHTLLTYPIVSRLGITANRAVTTAVGGTIVTDTLALLVLAVIASQARGNDIDEQFWMRLGIGLALYIALIQIAVPLVARWFFRSLGRDGVSQFVFVLATVFGCAALARAANAEPLVGAFLAGLALNRLIPHHGVLMNRIRFTGDAIFIPFFLLSVGMLLDVGVFLAGPRAWIVATTMVGTVILTKWLAAESTRLLLGYDRDQSRLVFGLSVPQAAATLAATIVGYDLGLFDDAVVNGAILMIFATCFLAPVFVERHGRALALSAARRPPEIQRPPQRILVGYANPRSGRALLDLAVLIRDPQEHPIYPLTVVEEGYDAPGNVVQAEHTLAGAVAQLASAEVPANPVTRIDLNAASGILRARRELRATDVIVGWQDHSGPRVRFFGSMLEHLSRDRDYTLIVARLLVPVNTSRRILVALPPNIEHEPGFDAFIALLANLVRELGIQILVIAEHHQEAPLRERFAPIKSLAGAGFRALDRWTAMRHTLAALASKDDLVLICGARPGSLAWEPLLASLPTRLAARLPEANLIVVYPPEEPDIRSEDPVTEMRL